MIVQILVDNSESWIVPYARKLNRLINDRFGTSQLIFDHNDVSEGDVLFLLSCEKIFKDLDLNTLNLVVHESDLPKGKGWSPLTWQILEGKNKIPNTLFEADRAVDSGKIYSQSYIKLKGDELLQEIKHLQGEATLKLCIEFLSFFPKVIGAEQVGEDSFYKRRTRQDSRLDVTKSIEEQFNLLRVCDNEKYPAFFSINNKTYLIKIYKSK